jgi:hypothetical protein
MLTADPAKRASLDEILLHPWVRNAMAARHIAPNNQEGEAGQQNDAEVHPDIGSTEETVEEVVALDELCTMVRNAARCA